jgi:predicted membrane protein
MPFLYLVLTLIVVAVVAGAVNTYPRTPDRIKPFVNLVLTLIVVGMALWLINNYVPMAESIKAILNFVVVVATCVLVLQTVGLWDQVIEMWHGMWARITRPRPATPANPEANQGKT